MSALNTSLTERPQIEIIIADTEELLQQCLAVRFNVFSDEQGFPEDTEIDQYDAPQRSVHFLLRLLPSLLPIGTIRIVQNPRKLTRLAILSEYRNFSFGRALVERAHLWVKEADPGTGGERPYDVVCHSQIYAKRFYAKFGYVEEGDEFDEDGAPHQKMVARLKP
ncbi:acyl-CoA N-acyltransferase [Dacryopinax primogenitus]|uniref:Acyl-CoA N-acyltransferase n=1 Tax=Dacryopinax primogenitus (strain DJM 731) TaxID=1858805 RepID=M5GF01_DACPD|nr:acyl-CoA N-acyltransferase [Dacryopinax primogenitus]EJU05857.1 acyl-CoA N-acyltransferase [Dacryopinax primogenitus]